MKRIIFVILILVLFGCQKIDSKYGCLDGFSYDSDVNACIRELDENSKGFAQLAVNYIGYEKGIAVLNVELQRCEGCAKVTLKTDEEIIVTIMSNEVRSITIEGEAAVHNPESCIRAGYTYDDALKACIGMELDDAKMQFAKIAVEHLNKEDILVMQVQLVKCPGCADVTADDSVVVIRDNKIVSVEKLEIFDFESCIAAGYPAMESYPRQCNDGTKTYTESLDQEVVEVQIVGETEEQAGITIEELAKHNTNSDCWIVYDGKVYDYSDAQIHPNMAKTFWRHCGQVSGFEEGARSKHSGSSSGRVENYGEYIGDLI